MPAVSAADNDNPVLTIAADKVGFIILKARAVDAKEASTGDNDGSNPTDDGDLESLEEGAGDLTRQELLDAIRSLNDDEKFELVALAWLGRGTFELSEWRTALETARSEHARRTAQYLLGLPMLGDYLEEGLAQFGESISDDDEID